MAVTNGSVNLTEGFPYIRYVFTDKEFKLDKGFWK